MLDISAVGLMSAPERPALGTSRRELSEDASSGIGNLLDVEKSSFEKRPRGVSLYTVAYLYMYRYQVR